MRVINFVDSIERINYGIWDAAISTARYLELNHGVESHLWFPTAKNRPDLPHLKTKGIDILTSQNIHTILLENNFKPDNTIIATHGCWQYPTRLGYNLHLKGYKWVMTPHGMLEPWSMKQKWLKKRVYFHLVEYFMMKRADAIRAVGTPEQENLSKLKRVTLVLIPNGIHPSNITTQETRIMKPLRYLFMARLHHKKGILPLLQAWQASSLANNPNHQLTIAGPDDGELKAINAILNDGKISNARYVGAVYNEEKKALLAESHFYLLPSFGEGFPTSLLEAMQNGLVPIITKGCNFPEAINEGLAIEVIPEKSSIIKGLEKSSQLTGNQWLSWSNRAANYVNTRYNLEIIANQQYQLYNSLLGK